MADRSKVAEAYAQVRADLSGLPGDLSQVPGIMQRVLSVSTLKAVRDMIGGNITGGLVSIATRGYQLQADQLRDLAKVAENQSRRLSGANDAKKKKELQDQAKLYRQQADVVSQHGSHVGETIALASRVGLTAIAGLAAAAAGYFASTVAAAHNASDNLKTAQMVRATGQAAGWSTEQLARMGEQLRQNSAFSQKDISGAQQALLRNPNVKGDQFKQALQTAADIAAITGQELPQAAAKLGEILGSLNDPLAINGEMLKEYGVLLNQSQQGALRNLVATRNWAGAQNYVLDALKGTRGAAKEASETGSGGFERLKNSLLAAVASIGGLNGDIGKLASRAADAVDAFMKLTVVRDVFSIITLNVFDLLGAIQDLTVVSSEDFKKWGEQISEIYHNVRDGVHELFEQIQATAKDALNFLLSSFGTSFDNIKSTVTDVLDSLSLFTTNFGLSAKLVWLGIQLAAQNAWDAIRDTAAGYVVVFESAFDAILAGAVATFDNLEKIFTGEKALSIGDAIGTAFSDGIKRGIAKYKFGDSDEAKRLKAEMGKVYLDIVESRDKIRKDRNDKAKKENAPLDKAGPTPPYIDTRPYKFEFTGFEEMYKKIQTAIYPSEEMNLQRAGVAAAEAAVNNGIITNEKLQQIHDAFKDAFGFGA